MSDAQTAVCEDISDIDTDGFPTAPQQDPYEPTRLQHNSEKNFINLTTKQTKCDGPCIGMLIEF